MNSFIKIIFFFSNLLSYQGGGAAWFVKIIEALNRMPKARMVDTCDQTGLWVITFCVFTALHLTMSTSMLMVVPGLLKAKVSEGDSVNYLTKWVINIYGCVPSFYNPMIKCLFIHKYIYTHRNVAPYFDISQCMLPRGTDVTDMKLFISTLSWKSCRMKIVCGLVWILPYLNVPLRVHSTTITAVAVVFIKIN